MSAEGFLKRNYLVCKTSSRNGEAGRSERSLEKCDTGNCVRPASGVSGVLGNVHISTNFLQMFAIYENTHCFPNLRRFP